MIIEPAPLVIRPMSMKELRTYYGVSRKTFKKRIEALPEALQALIPKTNGIMYASTVQKLVTHWEEK